MSPSGTGASSSFALAEEPLGGMRLQLAEDERQPVALGDERSGPPRRRLNGPADRRRGGDRGEEVRHVAVALGTDHERARARCGDPRAGKQVATSRVAAIAPACATPEPPSSTLAARARAEAGPERSARVHAERRREEDARQLHLVAVLAEAGSSGQRRWASPIRTTPGGPVVGSSAWSCWDEPHPAASSASATRAAARPRATTTEVEETDRVATKMIATTTVSRVRLRSTMCVPPCDCGREAQAAHAGIPPRVHEDEHDQGDRDEDVEDGERLQHRAKGSNAPLVLSAGGGRGGARTNPETHCDRRQPAQTGGRPGEGAGQLRAGAEHREGSGPRGERPTADRAPSGRPRAARRRISSTRSA